MSVVVRMEMPKSCKNCHFRFQMYCGFGKDISPEYILLENRPYWCPIICQLPKGHGRLVDADALLRDVEQYHVSDGKFQHWIELQHTIVPAERSENK